MNNNIHVEDKAAHLRRILLDMNSCAVGFSGGVDSTLLFAVAVEVLGERAIGITATSTTYPERELHQASEYAKAINGRHIIIVSEELDIPEFRRNPRNRCYYCKKELFGKLKEIADREGLSHILDGTNLDDATDHRPGKLAAQELNVRSPLVEAGFTKSDIRTLALSMGLAVWDKPAFACLSSRFPYGTEITAERVDQVGRAEESLMKLGFRTLRIRYHGSTARIELAKEDIERAAGALRSEIVRLLKEAGFTYAALDLEGYRTGAMNEEK